MENFTVSDFKPQKTRFMLAKAACKHFLPILTISLKLVEIFQREKILHFREMAGAFQSEALPKGLSYHLVVLKWWRYWKLGEKNTCIFGMFALINQFSADLQ